MKSAARITYLVAFTLLGTAASLAQMTPLQAYQAQMDADKAFQCAAWANADDGRSIDKSEIGRLTMYGYDQALIAFADIAKAGAAHESDRALYKRAPVDFWVGGLYTQSNLAVSRGLDYNVPTADHPYAELLTLRAANASKNFLEQGCDGFGKP